MNTQVIILPNKQVKIILDKEKDLQRLIQEYLGDDASDIFNSILDELKQEIKDLKTNLRLLALDLEG